MIRQGWFLLLGFALGCGGSTSNDAATGGAGSSGSVGAGAAGSSGATGSSEAAGSTAGMGAVGGGGPSAECDALVKQYATAVTQAQTCTLPDTPTSCVAAVDTSID